MRKLLSLITALLVGSFIHAQFGYLKKAELEKFKDSRTVVVLSSDSAYSASIRMAVEKYWNFSGTEFAYDTGLKQYSKGDFTFLVFSKGKGAKIKAKVCSSEEDFNGLQLLKKFKRRAPKEEVIARAFCGNRIDTADWEPELIRGVQLLSNYFNYAIEAKGQLTPSNYPTDKSVMINKKLLVPHKFLDIKGKVDANVILDGEIEEVDKEEIDKAITTQDQSTMIYYFSVDEKHCNKLVVTSEKSELMYYETDSPDKCSCNVSDLKALKNAKMKANK